MRSPMPFGASGFLPGVLHRIDVQTKKSPMPFGASGFLPYGYGYGDGDGSGGLQCLSALPAFSPSLKSRTFGGGEPRSPMPFGASGFLPNSAKSRHPFHVMQVSNAFRRFRLSPPCPSNLLIDRNREALQVAKASFFFGIRAVGGPESMTFHAIGSTRANSIFQWPGRQHPPFPGCGLAT